MEESGNLVLFSTHEYPDRNFTLRDELEILRKERCLDPMRNLPADAFDFLALALRSVDSMRETAHTLVADVSRPRGKSKAERELLESAKMQVARKILCARCLCKAVLPALI